MTKTILSRTWRYGLMMIGLVVFVIATGGCAPEDAVMGDQAEAGAEREAGTERVVEEQPERSPCQTHCGTSAREKYRECVDAGGTKLECGPEARGGMPACMEACEAESGTAQVTAKQSQRSPCQLSCGTTAKEKFRECMGAGGAKEECGPEARGAMPACVEACEAESPDE